jgi:hypothetical protein
MRASRQSRRAVERLSRRAAIVVIIAVLLLAIIGFIAELLRQKGWLGRRRRERH